MRVHEGKLVELDNVNKALKSKGDEHWASRRIIEPHSSPNHSVAWKAPDQGKLKFNCDSAVGAHFSLIAVVARDWRGYVCSFGYFGESLYHLPSLSKG
jgi:hypothetical protein